MISLDLAREWGHPKCTAPVCQPPCRPDVQSNIQPFMAVPQRKAGPRDAQVIVCLGGRDNVIEKPLCCRLHATVAPGFFSFTPRNPSKIARAIQYFFSGGVLSR